MAFSGMFGHLKIAHNSTHPLAEGAASCSYVAEIIIFFIFVASDPAKCRIG
jgi:hypothetical protein